MKFTAVTKLVPGMMLGQSLIGISHAENYTIGHILTEGDIQFFKEKGLFGIYTLEPQPAQILSPELMNKCIQAISKLDVDAIVSLSEQLVNELTSRPINLDFRSIRSFDDYLLHHSICVAVYAVATGIQLGMGEIQLKFLAQAGLLHDIGHIPQCHSVLIKKETLTTEEYEQLKKHPQDGYNILAQHEQISSIVKEAVLHHHENVNGTGYPDGQNFDIVTCLGGSQALQMVKHEKPDLILMDYEMPDMDGVTTVNELHKAGYRIPVIFLTGKCDKETVRKCGQCGAVDYILKPANPVYLRTRVNMALYQIDGNAFA